MLTGNSAHIMKTNLVRAFITLLIITPIVLLIMAGASQEDLKTTLYCFAGIVVYTTLLSIILKHRGKSKTFMFEGKKVKYSDVVDQKLLDFLETKGYDNETVIRYILKYSTNGEFKFKELIESGRRIERITSAFLWLITPEGHLFWYKLNDEYELRKKQEEQK